MAEEEVALKTLAESVFCTKEFQMFSRGEPTLSLRIGERGDPDFRLSDIWITLGARCTEP